MLQKVIQAIYRNNRPLFIRFFPVILTLNSPDFEKDHVIAYVTSAK